MEECQKKIVTRDHNYDPYEHRNLALPNTFWGALMHLLKSSLGSGILAFPSAIAAVGIIVGVGGTILSGILCTHTVHLLVGASLRLCKRAKKPYLGFAETAYVACQYGPKKLQPWANFAELFVDVALCLTHYTGLAVYVVFVCTSIQELVNYHHPEVDWWPIHYYMLMLMVPLILAYQIRELKHLVPFSFIANATLITAFLILLYYIFSGIGDVKIEDRKLYNDILNFPIFFSTVLFAMEGIGTMLPIENSMEKPGFLGCFGVLNIAMCFVVSLYTTVGLFGYLRFGDHVHANIIQELPPADVAAQIAKMCVAVAVFFTSMLQFYVPVDITWRRLDQFVPYVTRNYPNITQVILRILLVFVIVGVAAAVPKLDSIIGLVGSVFFSTLGLFIPAAIDILLNLGEDGDFGYLKWRLWKNILIMVVSWFALVSGSYYAIKGLVED